MERVNRISLLALASSILLLTGMAFEIPAETPEFASICRSRSEGAAAKPLVAPARADSQRFTVRSTS